MKTILVDAIHTFVLVDKGIFKAMYELLETYRHKKIILTGANDEQIIKFGLDQMPYEVFTLKHDPEKTNPDYYKKMLAFYALTADEVIYFEHHKEAVESASSVGITTYHYNKDTQDLKGLQQFLDKHLGA